MRALFFLYCFNRWRLATRIRLVLFCLLLGRYNSRYVTAQNNIVPEPVQRCSGCDIILRLRAINYRSLRHQTSHFKSTLERNSSANRASWDVVTAAYDPVCESRHWRRMFVLVHFTLPVLSYVLGTPNPCGIQPDRGGVSKSLSMWC